MSTTYQDLLKLEERLNVHRHCGVCGKSFVPSQTQQLVCSDECEKTSKKKQRGAKIMFFIPLLFILLYFLFIFVFR